MNFSRNGKAGGFSLLIGGVICSIIGACAVWYFGSDYTLICQRSTDRCVLEKSRFFGSNETVSEFPLSRLKSAEVETKTSRSGRKNRNKTTHRVILHTGDGDIPFSPVKTQNMTEHQQRANAINAFLKSSQEHLTTTQSGKTIRLIGYVFLAVGLWSGLRGLFGIIKKILFVSATHAGL